MSTVSSASACADRLNMPRIVCVASRHTELPQMTLMLISLCKEGLTRQSIFNSSAPPLEDLPPSKHCFLCDVSCSIISHVYCVCLSIFLYLYRTIRG